MIDSHCHLADEAFDGDLDEVVGRARAAGLSSALCVLAAGERAEAARVPRIAALWPAVRFAIGVHPHEAGRFVRATAPVMPAAALGAGEIRAAVRQAIASIPDVRALGEIGLDYHYDLSPREAQRAVFGTQVELAGEMHLPIVVHTREAERDTIALLEHAGAGRVRGVLHCFTGTAEMAAWAVHSGFYVSFAGIVTFRNAETLRAVAGEVPLDRLLVETDCPYLAPVPHRGKRNEPSFVVEVAKAIAHLKGIALDELDELVTANFQALFGVS